MPHPKDSPTSLVVANASSQGDGTTQYYFDMDGWSSFSVQIADTPGTGGDQTYTVSLSNTDDGTTLKASATYVACTSNLFGVASWTTDAFAVPTNHPITAKFGRLTVVRANEGGVTTGAWTVTLRFSA